jgi:hypothetical protein
MRTLVATLIVLTLTACASAPSSTSKSRSQDWWDYRDQVMEERDRGTVTPVKAEEQIHAKYREIYGLDPEMEGVFAYGRRLYVMAEAGVLSIDEADALASARVDEIMARRVADMEYRTWLESRFPPESSD